MFKVNNKDTRKTSITLFFFMVDFEYILHIFLRTIVDFKQVNVIWVARF